MLGRHVGGRPAPATWLPRSAVARLLGVRAGLVADGVKIRTLRRGRTIPWSEVAAVSLGSSPAAATPLPGVRLCLYGPASVLVPGLPRTGPRRSAALQLLAEAADHVGVAVVAPPGHRTRLAGVAVDRWADLDVRADGTWIVVGDVHLPSDYVVGTAAERRLRRRQMRTDPRRRRR